MLIVWPEIGTVIFWNDHVCWRSFISLRLQIVILRDMTGMTFLGGCSQTDIMNGYREQTRTAEFHTTTFEAINGQPIFVCETFGTNRLFGTANISEEGSIEGLVNQMHRYEFIMYKEMVPG